MHELHHDCYACGDRVDGIGLKFRRDGEGIAAEWFCDERFGSYPGIIHGGIIATVLDSAMTNCLLTREIVAVTAELCVRYHKPLETRSMAIVRAVIVDVHPPLYQVEAEIFQDGTLTAKAHAKFMQNDMWTEKANV